MLCILCIYTIAFVRSVRRLLVTAKAALSSPILVTLMMKALRCSETSVLTRSTRRNIPDDGILHVQLRLPSGSVIPARN
jgi:hypothetical protein